MARVTGTWHGPLPGCSWRPASTASSCYVLSIAPFFSTHLRHAAPHGAVQPHDCTRARPALQVVFLLRLLELAMQSRQMLREHTFYLPGADEGLLMELLPWLASLLVEAQLRGDSDRPGGGQARWLLAGLAG